jgi:hypothetical protein
MPSCALQSARSRRKGRTEFSERIRPAKPCRSEQIPQRAAVFVSVLAGFVRRFASCAGTELSPCVERGSVLHSHQYSMRWYIFPGSDFEVLWSAMNVRDSTFFLFSLDCRSSSWYWFVVEC